MIPVLNKLTNESSGVLETIEYHADSVDFGYIFNILRSQLYSDPELAVLREYSTNAVDAHVMSNKAAMPIRVVLPNTLDCFLKIRDFGTGLSNDEIRKVFTAYASSTKRATQAATGMLGIGSKSGFAYNDSFIVNSYQNGKMHSWNAFIDPTNMGAMSRMAEVDTDEPDGLEIIIPVKEKDIEKFHQRATYLFRFFSVLPDIHNLSVFRKEEISKYRIRPAAYSGSNWKYFGDKKQSYAIMGNIPYPIDESVFDANELTEEVKAILQGGIHIMFNIGDLEFAASREALQYTAHTKKSILDVLSQASKELVANITKTFSTCKTLWEAKILFNAVFDITGNLYILRNLFSKNFQFNGQTVNSNEFGISSNDNVQVSVYERNGSYDYRIGGYKVRGSSSYKIIAKSRHCVVINDSRLSSGLLNRIVPLIEGEKKFEKVYVLNYDDVPNAQASFEKRTGLDVEMTLVSQLPKEPLSKYYPRLKSNSGYSNPKHVAKEFIYHANPNIVLDKNSSYWEAVDVDPTSDTGIYLQIDAFMYANQHTGWMPPKELVSVLKYMTDIGIQVPTIYGFKLKSAELAKKNPNMVNLWDFIKNQFSVVKAANPTLEQEYVDRVHILSSMPRAEIQQYESLNIQGQSKLLGFLTSYNKAKSSTVNSKKHEAFKWLCDFNGYKMIAKPSVDLTKELNTIKQRYPLLSYMAERCNYEFGGAKKHLVEYVQMVDAVTP